ncbi:hypothetical protein I4F81_004288 [Pyropia yezoensis]|uniref:Uncharacterized protein n=1 Tax=Pyropia yezoensis TaxID=2788 RepID=A0ACC3BUY2_PYRYE|nr:hypothetical protein I4F81_004288 [Neopyropia yezoensis]
MGADASAFVPPPAALAAAAARRGVTRVEVRVHAVTAAAYAAGTVPDAATLAAWAAHIAGDDVRPAVRGRGRGWGRDGRGGGGVRAGGGGVPPPAPPVAVDRGVAAAAVADVVRAAAAAARASTVGGRLAPARWAAKRLLRGAAAVAAPAVGWASRDLLPCAVAAATVWPARAGEVAALAQLAAVHEADGKDNDAAAAAAAWAWGGGLADAAAWVEDAWMSVTHASAAAFARSPPAGWTAAPLLLTGGAAGVAAAHPLLPLSLDALAAAAATVSVRVSPTATFVYTNPAHPAVVAGTFTPPSVVASMPASEFVARTADHSREGGGGGALPPLYPHPHSGGGGGERVNHAFPILLK